MTRIPINHIMARAQDRQPGYVDECLSLGRVTGDCVEFDDEVYRSLVAKYRGDEQHEPTSLPCCGQ
jgi:hypothetical protein